MLLFSDANAILLEMIDIMTLFFTIKEISF